MTGFIFDPRGSVLTTGHLPEIPVEIIDYNLPMSVNSSAQTGSVTFSGSLPRNVSYMGLAIDVFPGMLWRIMPYDDFSGDVSTLAVADALTFLSESFIFEADFTSAGSWSTFVYRFLPYVREGETWRNKAETKGRFAPSYIAQTTKKPASYATALNAVAYPEFDDLKVGENYTTAEAAARYLLANGFEIRDYSIIYTGLSVGAQVVIGTVFFFDLDKRPDDLPAVFDFTTGNNNPVSLAFSSDIVSCVAFPSRAPLYLASDGSISSDINDQIPGSAVASDGLPDAQTAAAAIFAQNKNDHKIEFWTSEKLSANQPLRIKTERGIVDTSVSSIFATNGDARYKIVCGELPVTGSEKLRAAGWSFGQRLPLNPRKGEMRLTPDGVRYFDGRKWQAIGG